MIDFEKVQHYIMNATRPPFCLVDDDEWRNALMGAEEAFSNTDLDNQTTESYWNMIYFSAVYFCKGMMWAETKAGLREESNYPRY